MLLWLALPMMGQASGVGPPVLSDGRYPPLRLFPEHVAAIEALKAPPQVGARSALLADLDSGQTLFAKDAEAPLPPASTMKVMTALVTLLRANLEDKVVVSAAAAATPGSRMGLEAGETLTVEELLNGLLVSSGNDAAVALAEHVAGSEVAFVALMNETAADLGLKQTHFANPHGLDDPGQTMSAADLLTVTRAALQYPVFAKIVSTASAQVAGHSLQNTNELLGVYEGADGIKTGTTDDAGECLIASVNHDGRRTLAILLGSSNRYADARALLDYAQAGWQWGELLLPGAALDSEPDMDGQVHRLKVIGPQNFFLPKWEWSLAQPVRALDPSVPLTSTLPVGALRLELGADMLGQAPLGVWQAP